MSDESQSNENDLEPEDAVLISCIIPAYNEALRVSQTILSAIEYFDAHYASYEIIVVDDGSSDATARIIRQFERLKPTVKLLRCPSNRGKGFAVRLGIMNARGRDILYADADGATPFEELARLQRARDEGADVAIGSRALRSEETQVTTLWYRKVIGRVFNGIVNLLLLPQVADTQCGFKLFRREVARYIFSRQQADGFSFDVEILYLARISGCRISEVAVNWVNVPGSKVNLVLDSTKMFLDVVRFKLRAMSGRYNVSPVFERES